MSTSAESVTVAGRRKDPIPASEWKGIVAKYQGPDVRRAISQVIITLGLLTVTLVIMHLMLDPAPWLTVLLAFPCAGLLVRTFIIMHDCAHGSFLPWPKVNDAVGYFTGVLTFTPFAQWRRDHALHHASSGDLDRRGHGDINTLTVDEYLARDKWGKLRYRLFRHPAVLLGLGPIQLIIGQRFRGRSKATGTAQIKSVWATNFGIAGLIVLFTWLVGWKAVLLVYLPSYYVAAAAGVWLFYVQHQFEDAYWEEHENWDYATAAITGSSHLRLNPVLQWFTGSIGLHHVHHLGPRIPNYRLQRAHDENKLFHEAPVVTVREGVRALRLTLWDESRKRLVRFADIAARPLPY